MTKKHISEQSWGLLLLLSSVVDNDVVEKLCRWECINELEICLEAQLGAVGYLGSLRYVIGKRLEKLGAKHTSKVLDQFIGQASELAPNKDELDLAAALQEASDVLGLDLDAGESILMAAGIVRNLNSIVTGDKRAISSCPMIESHHTNIGVLRGRFVSLEQILGTLVEHLGQEELRRRVCSDCAADRTASICFSCAADALSDGGARDALSSYQADLANRSDGFSINSLSCIP